VVDVASFHQFTGLQQKDNLQQYQVMNMHASFPHYVHQVHVCLSASSRFAGRERT